MNPSPLQDWGSRYVSLVEMMGFEPTASSMRTKRSAK